MKLPGQPVGRVRPLGRYDTRGPTMVANAAVAAAGAGMGAAQAEAGAAAALAQALGAGADLVDGLYRGHAGAEYDRAVAEFQAREQEIRTLVTSAPVLQAEDVPEWVAVERTMPGTEEARTSFPMADVGAQMYEGTVERARGHALAKVTTPLARNRLEKVMPQLATRHRGQVLQHLLGVARDRDRAMVDVALEDLLNVGDEAGYQRALYRAVSTGLIEPGDYAERYQEMGELFDSRAYGELLMQARTPEEVDQAQEMIAAGVLPAGVDENGKPRFRRSRLDPDEMWTLHRRADTLLDQQEADRKRVQEANTGTLLTAFIGRKLTHRDIARALEAGHIAPRQAQTLINLHSARSDREERAVDRAERRHSRLLDLRAKEREEQVTDAFSGRIASVRLAPEGRVTDAGDRVRRDLDAAHLGAYPDGTPSMLPRLAGDEYAKLSGKLDAEVARLTRSPEYQTALSWIRTSYGWSPVGGLMGVREEDRASSAEAIADFTAALDDYMDRTGTEAKPVEWAMTNATLFSKARYEGQNLENFVAKHRGYNVQIWGLGYQDQESKDWTKASGTELQRIKDAVLMRIEQDVVEGRISEEQARIYYLQVSGQVAPLGLDEYLLVEGVE